MLTKAKLKKWAHVAGLVLTVASGATVWLAGLGLPLSAKLTATLALLVAILTNASKAIGKADELIAQLPIPEDETPAIVVQPTAIDKGKQP